MRGAALAVVACLAGPALPSGPGTARLLALDSDIKEVQQRWRRYRNVVKDGFFINDSMILLADYYSEEEAAEVLDDYPVAISLEGNSVEKEAPVERPPAVRVAPQRTESNTRVTEPPTEAVADPSASAPWVGGGGLEDGLEQVGHIYRGLI
jgi:hypothetical protein